MADGTAATPPAIPNQSADVPESQSYANAVSSRPSLSKFNVSVEGNSTVAVPDEVFENSPPLWEDFLVGHFPSPAPHVAKIHVIVNKIWNLGDKNIKIDVFAVNDITIKFRIRHESARLRVLRRGMWNICNLPMIVSKWTPIAEDAQPEIKSMPMWILIKKVPNSMFHWKGISYLASPVGYPKRLHQETELVTHFDEAKVFVEVDLTKDLLHRFSFTVQGEEFCVEYDYPWLPPRCGICRKWGHSENCCLASPGRASSPQRISLDNNSVKETSPIRKETVAASNESEKEVSASSGQETVETGKLAVAPNVSEQEMSVSSGNEIVESVEIAEVPKVSEAEVSGIKGTETAETEEGEIPSGSGDGEWKKVTSSGSKNSKSPGKSLVYGAVRIASPTSYDVLRDNDEEGDTLFTSMSGKDIQIDLDNSQRAANSDKSDTALRVPPPRSSKNSHRFLSASSNKPRDTVPSNVYKRNSQKKS